MAHPLLDEIRKSHGDKLDAMTGKRGEYPNDRAERIAASPKGHGSAQGDAAQPPVEEWEGAPARQVSNLGNVRK